ncbi:MAG: PLP-dependent transferase, partial [Gemmatimonadota bacterium]
MHAGDEDRAPGRPVVTPIAASATFHDSPVPEGDVRYTRYGTNPNHLVVAERIAALENAEAALVTASGMAAISLTLLAILRPGDHILAARALYGHTVRLLEEELLPLGFETSFV